MPPVVELDAGERIGAEMQRRRPCRRRSLDGLTFGHIRVSHPSERKPSLLVKLVCRRVRNAEGLRRGAIALDIFPVQSELPEWFVLWSTTRRCCQNGQGRFAP